MTSSVACQHTLLLPGPSVAGNALLCRLVWLDEHNPETIVATIADDAGNVWIQACDFGWGRIYYSHPANSARIVRLLLSRPCNVEMRVHEYENVCISISSHVLHGYVISVIEETPSLLESLPRKIHLDLD
jgi:hypothetical protein